MASRAGHGHDTSLIRLQLPPRTHTCEPANISEQTDRRLMSFVARGKRGGEAEEGKMGPRIRITESFVIANRKPYRRRGYDARARGNKINGGLCAKSPPRRLPEDTSTPLRSVTISSRALHSPRDRSIPLSRSRGIKTHEPSRARSERYVGTYHASTCHLVTFADSRRAPARAPSAVVEREINDVRYLDSSLRRTVESPV